jgi:hypothetical protein
MLAIHRIQSNIYFYRYCGYEVNENKTSDSSAKSPDSQRKATPLTIISRATFAFSQSPLNKPKIAHEPIRSGEPYGPHDDMSKNKQKLYAKSDGEAEMNSENDSPRRASLDVPRRSKLKASR